MNLQTSNNICVPKVQHRNFGQYVNCSADSRTFSNTTRTDNCKGVTSTNNAFIGFLANHFAVLVVLSDSENGLFFLDGTKQGKIQLAINLSAHFVWNENLVYILQGNQPFGNAFLPYGFIVFWQDAEFIIQCLTHYHFGHRLQYIIHQLHPQYLCVVVSWQIFLQSENL